jgi:carboxymethylenebutenolidase
MCFDPDSRPPIAPIAGGAVEHERLRLRSADGASFAAFHARSSEATGRGVLILPDVRGLHRYYEELALRFAEAGVDALVIDYFGRSATDDDRGEAFPFMDHVAQTQWLQLRADAVAGAHVLRAGDRVTSLATVGFCFGGRLSFLLGAVRQVGAAGVIGFYGVPVGPARAGMPAPADVAPEVRGRVLGLFGGADQAIPPESIEGFRDALLGAGVEHEIVVYPGAPHSFFDRKQEQFAEESADAWERVLAFIGASPG